MRVEAGTDGDGHAAARCPVAHAYEIADFRGAVYRDGVQDEINYADEAGKRGILVATRGVCGRSRVARLALDGHNGKAVRRGHTVRTACPKRNR